MKNFCDARVELEACKGANIVECFREALQIALAENRVVGFVFNDIHYTVSPEAVIGWLLPK